MMAFDTNYLVRHLVQDDPKQCREVAATLRSEAGQGRRVLLYDIVLCETMWVLESAYAATRNDLLQALNALNDEPLFEFEHPERVITAIRRYQHGKANFADYLILGMGKEKRLELKTFDKRLKAEIAAESKD